MLIMFVAMLSPLFLLGLLLFFWKWRMDRDSRRDPVNIKVLNSAGDGLRSRLEKLSDSFDGGLSLAVIAGPILFGVWAFSRLQAGGFRWSISEIGALEVSLGLLALVIVCGCVVFLARVAGEARRCRQGLDAERAVAQCLNQVMSEGGMAFHDFPGDRFNIDHIVIGHSAVFAIETKSRKKPAQGGRESARVVYDGVRLTFPDHVETKPVEQTKAQARWLQDFLAQAVGEPVRVIPYLALPGWFVDNKVARPDVLVGNARNPMFMVRPGFGPPLAEAMKRRIAHVLSERYPAVF